MKNYTDGATAPVGGTQAPVVHITPDSDATKKLRTKVAEAWKVAAGTTYGSPEHNTANLAFYKLDRELKESIANDKKAEQEAINVQRRNERVALADTMVADAIAAYIAESDKKASLEDKAAAGDKAKASRELVVNELTAKYATSTPSKPATDGLAPAGGKGAKGQEILAMYKSNEAAGMTDTDNRKAIVKAGHAVGTVGSVAKAYLDTKA